MDQIPQHIFILNQVFDMEKKVAKLPDARSLTRNLNRIKQSFSEIGLNYHDPTGEAYNETRTDCEATISGESVENLYIEEVIKPIIRLQQDGFHTIIQRGVVIVRAKNNEV